MTEKKRKRGRPSRYGPLVIRRVAPPVRTKRDKLIALVEDGDTFEVVVQKGVDAGLGDRELVFDMLKGVLATKSSCLKLEE